MPTGCFSKNHVWFHSKPRVVSPKTMCGFTQNHVWFHFEPRVVFKKGPFWPKNDKIVSIAKQAFLPVPGDQNDKIPNNQNQVASHRIRSQSQFSVAVTVSSLRKYPMSNPQQKK